MPNMNQLIKASNVAASTFAKRLGMTRTAIAGFILSLLPIPGISQAGAVLERWASTKNGKHQLDVMCHEIEKLGINLDNVSSVEEAIAQLAGVVAKNDVALQKMMEISEALGSEHSEFIMETDKNSYQELARSVVDSARVLISATQNSTNLVQESEIHSPVTRLHASGGSRNIIDRTQFKGLKGAVGMDGITTEGDIEVSDSSISLGPGSAIIFGETPNMMSGNCPLCEAPITVDRRQLAGDAQVQCPSCKNLLQL